jgi:crossover junction endodeoxyribonuclease RuvC
MRILGIDPGLRFTGWGMISSQGQVSRYLDSGRLVSTTKADLPQRLCEIYQGLTEVIQTFQPDEVAVEQTFVNKDAVATLKLGQARGVALVVPALAGLPVFEYAPNKVKKTIVGAGHADKKQIETMVRMLLPKARFESPDAADALAIALCHAQHRSCKGLSALSL